MVNNFERIHKEIKTETKKLALENDLNYEALLDLIMHIVDFEDQHMLSRTNIKQNVTRINIKQKVKGIIQKTAVEQIKKD